MYFITGETIEKFRVGPISFKMEVNAAVKTAHFYNTLVYIMFALNLPSIQMIGMKGILTIILYCILFIH